MKILKVLLPALFGLLMLSNNAVAEKNNVTAVANQCHEYLNFQATKLRSSKQVDFCQAFKGKALLVVNTASKCGFTPQFKGLEKLHQQYGDKLAIVGFPSDDFRQEHADSEKVAEVCYVNYGVTFTMLETSKVKGQNANELFKRLSKTTGSEPSWNFSKYLVSADGKNVKHFASHVKPNDKDLLKSIESLL